MLSPKSSGSLCAPEPEEGAPVRRVVVEPGHGPVIHDPYGKIREYVDHRLLREREVLDSLRGGRNTIPAIAARIYADLPAPLQSVGRLSIEAHLIKLVREGRVVRKGERYLLGGEE